MEYGRRTKTWPPNPIHPLRPSCSEHLFAHTYHTAPTTAKVDPATANMFGWWGDGVYLNHAGVPEVVVPIGQVEYWSA